MAEREGFEPSVRYHRTHDFQSCSLSRSDTSPYRNNVPCNDTWYVIHCQGLFHGGGDVVGEADECGVGRVVERALDVERRADDRHVFEFVRHVGDHALHCAGGPGVIADNRYLATLEVQCLEFVEEVFHCQVEAEVVGRRHADEVGIFPGVGDDV